MAFCRTKHDPEMDYLPSETSLSTTPPQILTILERKKTQPGHEKSCTTRNRDLACGRPVGEL